jgi:hypothetical protein
MTLIHQGTPGKSLLPSEVSRWGARIAFGSCWVGSLILVNYEMNSFGHESRKSGAEPGQFERILGRSHALFLPEVEFLAFSFRIQYFKPKSAILAVK